MSKIKILILLGFVTFHSNSLWADSPTLQEVLALRRVESPASALLLGVGVDSGKHIKVLSDKVVQKNDEYQVREIQLKAKDIGPIVLYKKDPVQNLKRSKPTIFLLGGIETGAKAVNLVEINENLSVVAIDFPIDMELSPLSEIDKYLLQILEAEAHIVIAYRWLLDQQDVNSNKISSVNVSFGSYIAPLALRILNAFGFQPRATVFAYGGADMLPFLDADLKRIKNAKDRKSIEKLIKKVTDVIEPTQHLEDLVGPFLVVNGIQDKKIPKQSSESLFKNLPEPKQLLNLNVPHINVDKPEVIDLSFKEIEVWLRTQNAL